MKLRMLTRADVQRAVSMSQAIEAVKDAFAQLSAGYADVPLRTQLQVPRHQGVTILMPAYLQRSDSLAVKIVSVFPNNSKQGLPTTQALVLVLDAVTGLPIAAMDGTYLTALRTGAASGAATDLLARRDARSVAILGAGAQGRTQLLGVCTVRSIERVWVYDQARARSAQYVAEMQRMGGRIPADIAVADTAREAVVEADVICTATTSTAALFCDADLKPGVHINAIGAYTPQMQEVDEATVAHARVAVDSRAACLAEAGDLIIPLRKGLISASILSELGEIMLGTQPSRQNEREVTLFKAVGNAAQDVAISRLVLLCAQQQGLGTEVEL